MGHQTALVDKLPEAEQALVRILLWSVKAHMIAERRRPCESLATNVTIVRLRRPMGALMGDKVRSSRESVAAHHAKVRFLAGVGALVSHKRRAVLELAFAERTYEFFRPD